MKKIHYLVLACILTTISFAQETIKLKVKENKVPCTAGAGKMQCLQVQEGKSKDWTYFYNNIQGFDYQPGYQYTLKVLKTKKEGLLPADVSSFEYKLKKIVRKKKVKMSESQGMLTFVDGKKWKLIKLDNEVKNFGNARIELNVAENKVTGNNGCNNFFGTFSTSNDKITFNNLGSTRKACFNDEVAQTETKIMNYLSKGTLRFDVADQTLNFYDNERLIMIFGLEQ